MSDPRKTMDPARAYALWAADYPPEAHNPLMRAEERVLLGLLPAGLAGARVLDAGCGSGRYLRHAVARGAATAVGVDLSAEMLGRGRDGGVPGLLVRGRLESPPLAADWADITICALALGHLATLPPALAGLAGVTRPGGLVLASDFHPACALQGGRRTFRTGGRRIAVAHHVHTVDDWRAAAAECGLRVERIVEAYLEPRDVESGENPPPEAFSIPVVLAVALRRRG